ncbi:DUF4956 domain-containing protein [Brachybacterium sp.]|uniref:DUF4956 domain-containing protein n=1 Tax=Brachybacterium sp. TaxID=1891286 RepID=UPI002ED30B05
MSAITLYALDLAAAAVLTFGIYWPRHHRRDLVVAFLGINVGVLAVSALLATSAVSAGIGLGLFGVLSIIRLRSDELAQHEIAYYFAFLALGLVGGLSVSPTAAAAFMGLIVVTMVVVDHPSLLGRHRRQLIVVDRALADEDELRAHLEQMLAAQVTGMIVQRLDTVGDTTAVDVRFRVSPGGASAPAAGLAEPREDRRPTSGEHGLLSDDGGTAASRTSDHGADARMATVSR